MTLHVDIVSAEKEIFSGTAEMVFAPAIMGEVGIAPRHTQMLTPLKAGEVRIRTHDSEEQTFYVSGGMLEVQPHVVTILADTAMRAKDIDEAEAIKAKEHAEQELAGKNANMDYARATAELAEAVAQLRTLERIRKMSK